MVILFWYVSDALLETMFTCHIDGNFWGSETKIKHRKYTRMVTGQKYKDKYKISHVDHSNLGMYTVCEPQGDGE